MVFWVLDSVLQPSNLLDKWVIVKCVGLVLVLRKLNEMYPQSQRQFINVDHFQRKSDQILLER